ncbi:hypothetical protein PH7735_03234 [Shimia thalassica]|uniref:Uncharacterized protein n=1 Tax=Shimia thalassica TaxID=1715693 RepID=A0A0P1IEB1_9RHOB|nr:hypothetical protein [Shimia thalassica]CUK08353.1 hypothetical protein PH7735_03234 [Shimia thalassica]
MIESILAFIIDLGTSDVCGGWPGWFKYAEKQFEHVLVGVLFGIFWLPLRVVAFAGWLAKELFSDLSDCSWSWFVALDSVADLAFAGVGVALAVIAKRCLKRAGSFSRSVS